MAWLDAHAVVAMVAAKRTNLLEQCVRQFGNNEQYKNDERYIDVCIKYMYVSLVLSLRASIGLSNSM